MDGLAALNLCPSGPDNPNPAFCRGRPAAKASKSTAMRARRDVGEQVGNQCEHPRSAIGSEREQKRKNRRCLRGVVDVDVEATLGGEALP